MTPAASSISADEPVDWIGEDERRIQTLPRREIRRRNLLHPVTATLVFHPDGRVFLQQRTLTKDVYAGLYDPCVGGTVASGESFAVNAAREIAEELGISGAALYYLLQHRFRDEVTNSLIRLYGCVYDGPVTLQPEEVAWGEWSDAAQVESLIRAGRVCPDSAEGWRLYDERFGLRYNFAAKIAPRLKPVREDDP